MTAFRLRAILTAYRQVMEASWPALHPSMPARAVGWASASDAELQSDLDDLLREASLPSCVVRVFWKTGPQFVFGGCNALFAKDAGFADPKDLIGLNDFDPRVPWMPQAAKYRADDTQVVVSGSAKLDILERQKSAVGMVWVRAGKAPIRLNTGEVIGIFGMYEVMDDTAGGSLFAARQGPGTPPS